MHARATTAVLTASALLILTSSAFGAECPVDHDKLVNALKQSNKAAGGPGNGGYDTHQWAAVVTRDGTVCAVAFSGTKAGDQWPGSRAIAMEKANTANGFSVKQMAISTANAFAPTQPGQPLYGLNASSPPSAELANGDANQFGTPSDHMVGKRVGGIIAFGGGLALYSDTDVVGGLGVSGDSSCADHNVAWRVRDQLGLDHVPAGVSPTNDDNVIYDVVNGVSATGWGHPNCSAAATAVGKALPATNKTGPS